MNNQPAFPTFRQIDSIYGKYQEGEAGMTLRDYFAAKAMQTMLHGTTSRENVARYAYSMADEMLAVRGQKHG